MNDIDRDTEFIWHLLMYYSTITMVNYWFRTFSEFLCFCYCKNLCTYQPEIQFWFIAFTDLLNYQSLSVVCSRSTEICKLIIWIEFNFKQHILFCFLEWFQNLRVLFIWGLAEKFTGLPRYLSWNVTKWGFIFQHSPPNSPCTSSTSVAVLRSDWSKKLSTADMTSWYELFSL